ncbi:MAG: mannose-1-phosphate guanylyltransferase/mannose-6-phosphate isomerase [Deltaproteobacteria bacterium]|nr:MAG: mannose-1-phosphate guanylyltransferase/mannose-6-phosphate isomerase [Deltaproteobacteria bacterium]
MKEGKVYPVILAGGSGTRFWPLSRQAWPKQLMKLTGDDSFIQMTAKRAASIPGAEKIYVVAGKELSEKIRFELTGFSFPLEFVVEPAPKNTAPAIALAADRIVKESGDGIMVVLPSDHLIREEEKFVESMGKAIKASEEGFLVTIGIEPSRPETGYGYIKRGAPAGDGFFLVERFVEKPDREKAETYLAEGGYYWNSGMFVWKASRFLEEVEKHFPELADAVGEGDKDLFAERFHSLPSISVDYAIMEKATSVAVVPGSFFWSDVGSWSSLDELFEKDERGNVVVGKALPLECENSIFYGGDSLLAGVGLKEMIVVSTGDATLVVPKEKAQDVRKVAEKLREEGVPEGLEHRKTVRPWGSYTILLSGPGFKIKKIEVKPGHRLSLQMHYHRSEHWVVIGGTARVTRGEETYFVHEGESTFIPKSTKHRLENPGKVPLLIIEVQNGEYVEEDDIIRFEDDYQREL